MKDNKIIYTLRGIGIGFIVAALLFFSLKNVLIQETDNNITDTEIMLMARNLGMIPLTELDDVVLNDEDLIERAKALGMDFIE